jgi:hypothetical protein
VRSPLRAVIALALILTSCGSLTSASPPPSRSAAASASPTASVSASAPGRALSAAEAQRLVGGRVAATLDALKRRDGAALAALAHPTKGVRFTPYPFVTTARDVVLARSDLMNAYADTKTRTWGVTDGKGDPITLTFSDYNARYIYSRDFASASKTAYNKPIGSGNSIDNTADVYPNAVLFEAYDPGPDPAMESFQWQSLRLLFEADGATWYLVGVVHGEWTI